MSGLTVTDIVAARAEFPGRGIDASEIWHGPELLHRHARHHTAHAALTAQILDLLTGTATEKPAPGPAHLQEPLSDSETRILRYLPTNLTAPEIAGQLYVSVHTVKTHMRHLYAKLGTHRRAETVEQARTLGLLAPALRKS